MFGLLDVSFLHRPLRESHDASGAAYVAFWKICLESCDVLLFAWWYTCKNCSTYKPAAFRVSSFPGAFN